MESLAVCVRGEAAHQFRAVKRHLMQIVVQHRRAPTVQHHTGIYGHQSLRVLRQLATYCLSLQRDSGESAFDVGSKSFQGLLSSGGVVADAQQTQMIMIR